MPEERDDKQISLDLPEKAAPSEKAAADKPADEEIILDYRGFQIEKGFLVGYGLDHDEKYRYLQDIYVLK